MHKQLINITNGEFEINDGFIVSNKTSLTELQKHFGKNPPFSNTQYKIGNLFFKFGFDIKNEVVKEIHFEIETEPKERAEWTFNHVFETDWIKAQTNDKTEFNWDIISPGNSSYFVGFKWGSINVTFDIFGGYFHTFLAYK